jgi:hypothetical protein
VRCRLSGRRPSVYVLDWCTCFCASLAVSTGMMEIRPWGGQHQHSQTETQTSRRSTSKIRSQRQKGGVGVNGHRQEASGHDEKFPDPRITAAAVLHDVEQL